MKLGKKILLLTLVPLAAISLIASGLCYVNFKKTMVGEVERQLYLAAYAIEVECYSNPTEAIHEIVKEFKEVQGVDITIFDDNIRTITTVAGAENTAMDNGILTSIKTGQNYFSTNANVNGQRYYGYYIPTFKNGEYVGAIFSGEPSERVNKLITSNILQMIVLIYAFCFIVALLTWSLVRKIVKRMNLVSESVETVANNDLTNNYELYENEYDETYSMYNHTANMVNNLKRIVINLKGMANKLTNVAINLKEFATKTSNATNEMTDAVEEITKGAASQAEETANANQKVGSVADELNKIGINANELDDVAKSMNAVKNNAMVVLDSLKKANDEIVRDVQNMNTQVGITSESVEKIQNAVNVIKEIADQTKLLSLNANIEAARAGEAGRGFSVVASSIGELATQSADSSEVIEKILKDLTKNYALIEDNMKNTTSNVDFQSQKIGETYDVFNSLGTNINNTVDRVNNINSMIEIINTNIVEIVDIIANLSAISEENSASTQETMAGIEELNATMLEVLDKAQTVEQSANELNKEVSVFKTE